MWPCQIKPGSGFPNEKDPGMCFCSAVRTQADVNTQHISLFPGLHQNTYHISPAVKCLWHWHTKLNGQSPHGWKYVPFSPSFKHTHLLWSGQFRGLVLLHFYVQSRTQWSKYRSTGLYGGGGGAYVILDLRLPPSLPRRKQELSLPSGKWLLFYSDEVALDSWTGACPSHHPQVNPKLQQGKINQ